MLYHDPRPQLSPTEGRGCCVSAQGLRKLTAQSQRCRRVCPSHDRNLQGGYMLSPIPIFITQTYYPKPNQPIGKLSSPYFLAFHFRIFHIFTFFFQILPILEGKLFYFFQSSTHLLGLFRALQPLHHMLALKISLHYPLSPSVSLSSISSS